MYDNSRRDDDGSVINYNRRNASFADFLGFEPSFFDDVNTMLSRFGSNNWDRPFKESEGYHAYKTKNGVVIVFDTTGIAERDISVKTKVNSDKTGLAITVSGETVPFPELQLKNRATYNIACSLPSSAKYDSAQFKVKDGYTYVFIKLSYPVDPTGEFTDVEKITDDKKTNW
jgi:HSP20 family molecular chaperone IbpA